MMMNEKKYKVLFIQPSPYDQDGQVIKKKRLYFVGLTFPLLAALTPDNWEVEICLETIEDIPFDSDADLIAVGTMGHAVHRSIDIAKEFRKRGKTIVTGGYMASLMKDDALDYSDSVIVGDADEAWPKVLRDFEIGCLKKQYDQALEIFDPPLPRYELLLNKSIGDFLPVQAARGCPHACFFCSVYCLYRRRYYKRSTESVIRDISHIKALGFKKFLLLDDNLVSDPAYAIELCHEIEKLNMQWFSQCSITLADNDELLKAVANSGCIGLSFGLESISQESMNSMGKSWGKVSEYQAQMKKIRQAGIDVSTEMVVGADGDTLDSIRNTAAFVRKNRVVVPRFYILTPIPGTDFHTEMLRENRIINDDYFTYDSTRAVHQPKNMTAGELTEAYWQLYTDIFRFPNILIRVFLQPGFLKHPLRHIFYLMVNLYYRQQIKQKITPNII